MEETQPDHGVFDIAAIAAGLKPVDSQPVAATVTATADGSVRVLHVTQPAPAHHHAMSDEYAYILSGSATFYASTGAPRTLTRGEMFFVTRGTVHGISEIHEGPLVLLIFDTPRRTPGDIIFLRTDSQ